MNKFHKVLAAKMLDMAADEFSNHGCNDFTLEDTPENRDFYVKMMKETCGEDVEVTPSKGKIYAMDYSIMNYLAGMLEKEAEND